MTSRNEILQGVTGFLDRLLAHLTESGFDLFESAIDHVCYRVASAEEYSRRKILFSQIGKLLAETPVGGRLIATYKLDLPILFRNWTIPLIELPAPKPGVPYASGWEHAEFVIPEDFDSFMRKYPHVTFDSQAAAKASNPEIRVSFGAIAAKFHRQSLADVIAFEQSGGAKLGIEKIVSGGQTGADRAALEFALARGIPHGGWCPKDRLAEDGRVPDCYRMQETAESDYLVRTEKNVIDSDATVIFSLRPRLEGGSRYTMAMAKKHGKPALHLTPEHLDPAGELRDFVARHGVRVLNVAGPRASKEAGVAAFVTEVLSAYFSL